MPTENKPASFEREDRYAVIKYKKLTDQQWTLLPTMLDNFAGARVDAVVVESDWPEYHLVWAMLEHRMAGKPVPDFNAWRRADELQQHLADAERRNDAMVGLLHRAQAVIGGEGWNELEADIYAALNIPQ